MPKFVHVREYVVVPLNDVTISTCRSHAREEWAAGEEISQTRDCQISLDSKVRNIGTTHSIQQKTCREISSIKSTHPIDTYSRVEKWIKAMAPSSRSSISGLQMPSMPTPSFVSSFKFSPSWKTSPSEISHAFSGRKVNASQPRMRSALNRCCASPYDRSRFKLFSYLRK